MISVEKHFTISEPGHLVTEASDLGWRAGQTGFVQAYPDSADEGLRVLFPDGVEVMFVVVGYLERDGELMGWQLEPTHPRLCRAHPWRMTIFND